MHYGGHLGGYGCSRRANMPGITDVTIDIETCTIRKHMIITDNSQRPMSAAIAKVPPRSTKILKFRMHEIGFKYLVYAAIASTALTTGVTLILTILLN